jgi:hypothetical protein
MYEIVNQKEKKTDKNKIKKTIFSLFLGIYDLETETEPESFATFGGYDQGVVENSMNTEENKQRKISDPSFKGLDEFKNTNVNEEDDALKGLWSLDLAKSTLE